MQEESPVPPSSAPPTASCSPSPLLGVVHSPRWFPGLAKQEGRVPGVLREKGGSEVLLENKLHPFSIFIRREGSEQSSTTQVCVNGDDPFLFKFILFLFLFCLNNVLFCCLFYFFFFVTRTKIRNRKAVFKADGPVEGSETLHDRVGVIVSVRLVSLCASCVISQALFWIVCFVFLLSGFVLWFCFLFFHARAKKKNLCTWGKQQLFF